MLVRRYGVRVSAHGLWRAHRLRQAGGATAVIIDVDGCMTDGRFALDMGGRKISKVWGPDDHDAIRWARGCGLDVQLITADRDGFQMAAARARHMGVKCTVMSPEERTAALANNDPWRTVYIGDGFYDFMPMRASWFGIATAGALQQTKSEADAVTTRCGGDRAVAQALTFTTRWLIP